MEAGPPQIKSSGWMDGVEFVLLYEMQFIVFLDGGVCVWGWVAAVGEKRRGTIRRFTPCVIYRSTVAHVSLWRRVVPPRDKRDKGLNRESERERNSCVQTTSTHRVPEKTTKKP